METLSRESEASIPPPKSAYELAHEEFEGLLDATPLEIRDANNGEMFQAARREFLVKFVEEVAVPKDIDQLARVRKDYTTAQSLLRAVNAVNPYTPKSFEGLSREEARDEAVRAEVAWAELFMREQFPTKQFPLRDLQIVARLALRGEGSADNLPESIKSKVSKILSRHVDSFSYLKGFEETRQGELEDSPDRSAWIDRALAEYGISADSSEWKERGRELPLSVIREERAKEVAKRARQADLAKAEKVRSSVESIKAGENSLALLEATRKQLEIQHNKVSLELGELKEKTSGVGGRIRGFLNPEYGVQINKKEAELAKLADSMVTKEQEIAALKDRWN